MWYYSIYHIREDLHEHSYGAVKVAWLQQEEGTNEWVYCYTQTNSGAVTSAPICLSI